MISGTRYDFGAQNRDAIYANYDIEALHTGKPNTVASLKQIPSYDPSKARGAEQLDRR